MASRPLKSSESSISGMTQKAFAADGIALAMKAGNTHFSGGYVPQWTMEDVLKVFNGTYQYWDEVPGCEDHDQIVLIGRDSNSGTRASFEEITGLEDDAGYLDILSGSSWQTIVELTSNGAVHDAVVADEDAIGYIGLGYIDSAVDTIDLWNVDNYYQATADNVKSGDYPISRNLYLIYRYEIPEDAEDFVDFIFSIKGQAIVEDEGFVKL